MFYIECIWCHGQVEDCSQCGGEGRIGRHRCPNFYVSQRELDVVSGIALVESSILPDAGGWHDQAATFVQAHPLVASEIAKAREAAQKRAQDKASRNRR